MEQPSNKAWVTLLSLTQRDSGYFAGVLVLDYSLKAVGSKYPLVVMATSDLPKEVKDILTIRNIPIVDIDRLSATVHNSAIKEARFAETWTKLSVFGLDQFERVALLDSDMLVRRNMDELLEMDLEEGWIAAAHACACNPRGFAHYPKDWVPANCAYTNREHPPPILNDSPRPYFLLNSGTVVVRPSKEAFVNIKRFLEESPLVESFQFPDQDLVAEFYRGKWKPLRYVYNALKTLRVIHRDLWSDDEVKCIHYILNDKPWTKRIVEGAQSQDEHFEVNTWWWDAYNGLSKEIAETNSEDSKRIWSYIEGHVAK